MAEKRRISGKMEIGLIENARISSKIEQKDLKQAIAYKAALLQIGWAR